MGLVGRHVGGVPIWNREWDILAVLDGCRFDTFDEEYDDDVEAIRSVASTSHMWLSKTFDGRDNSTVAYISGNPYASNLEPNEFGYFHIEPVEMTDYGIETVHPRALTERAIYVWRRRVELGIDSLVIHYMQPHVPFRSRPEWFENWSGTEGWGSGVWDELRAGQFGRDEFFEAYKDNLRWCLGEDGLETLRRNCSAQIGITADHGNGAGEWGLYGHPTGGLAPSIRTVPWAAVQGEDRETLDPDVEEASTGIDAQSQLEALGYM